MPAIFTIGHSTRPLAKLVEVLRAHGVRAEGFRNREERDAGGVASGPAGGARDAIANVRQPGSKRGGVEHYFGSCATRALAVAALAPSGESFK